ncbi:hypothetical protein BCR33DRAFT_858424 [Rhizoclosmatium globosum]|uniref:Beta-glucuronidase C-terminal domain-containing protein n=1 Tax=Rhizoclosmatium globosum TaxID=329046 RepID=A0A1Y2AYE5_9FUNG|nr:hypothetical protein BCR33DRAFT_858424 [Rhizoclosmatium globosum]|eukprot:ORY27591.1 hypothetical protein BCR33DRAFT_858424 [Rhizoclosmatium globosum]
MSVVSFLAADALPPPISGHTIAPNYVGFSMEEPCVARSPLVLSNGTPNPGLINLMNTLNNRTTSSFPFFLRIGGNSADNVWYAQTTGVEKGVNTTCVVDSNGMKNVSTFYSALAVPVKTSVGVNMAPTSTNDQISMAVQYLKGAVLPNWKSEQFLGVELGNEPEDWVQGKIRPAKPYNITTAYPTEWAALATGITSGLGQPTQFVGPATSIGTSLGRSILQSFLSTKPSVNPITLHYYAENIKSSTDPKDLLQYPTDTTYSFLSTVHTPKYDFVLGETNSRSSGGTGGVSNVYAATLWTLDHLATSAWSGFKGAWFHGAVQGSTDKATSNVFVASAGGYSPIYVNLNDPTLINARPGFYALLGFTRVLNWVGTAGIQIVRGGGAQVKVDAVRGVKYFAFVDPTVTSRWSAVIVNKNSTEVVIQFGPPTGFATSLTGSVELIQQTTGDISAVSGISIGGQTFDGTRDGFPVGLYNAAKISASNSLYSVTVPAFSAALVFLGQPDPSNNAAAVSPGAQTTNRTSSAAKLGAFLMLTVVSFIFLF